MLAGPQQTVNSCAYLVRGLAVPSLGAIAGGRCGRQLMDRKQQITDLFTASVPFHMF